MPSPAADRLAAFKGFFMFVSLLAAAFVLAPVQDAAAPAPPSSERYEQAMRCAGVMAAKSSLHAFTGDTQAKAATDRNGRGFIIAATGFAQPLGLTQQQLSDAFAASTAAALRPVTQTQGDQAAADAALARLNADHDGCIALARGWVSEANSAS